MVVCCDYEHRRNLCLQNKNFNLLPHHHTNGTCAINPVKQQFIEAAIPRSGNSLKWQFIKAAIHQSGNSSKQQFIEAAIHRMAFSSNAQTHLTVLKIR
jgi:hypothetical protein